MYSLFTALISCILNLGLTPLVIYIAHKKKWFDTLDDRKIHRGNVPRLGGIGIFWTSFLPIAALSLISYFNPDHTVEPAYLPLLGGMFIVHALSLVDDFKRLSAKLRFSVQVIVSLVLCWFGFRFHSIWIPGIGAWTIPVWLSWTVTVIWITGVINAINMIDGMDGLCGGISIIAACTYGILYVIRGEAMPALFAFALVGALAGFLFYNFPPARIFMGDSGSTYLGFMVAVLPLLSRSQANYDIQLFLGVTVIVIPIFDTFAAIWRRLRAGKSVMEPDKWHIHHKLLKMGLGVRSILAMIYASTMALGAINILSAFMGRLAFFIIAMSAWVFILGLFSLLHFLKQHRFNARVL
jgi:UDP-GlcNAc:undecaprenyl-phosphate/decaprenyl-phosphate GlcNAc-1-phosphate transferase